MLSSYEGQTVSSIEVAGRTDIDATRFTPQFIQQQGQPFSEQKVNQTAEAIKSAGKFDAVRIDVNPEADGVRVIYVVQPAVYFGIFKFPGAEQFPYSRLVQVSNYPIQAPFNSVEVETDRVALLNFFRQTGFFQAEVRSEVEVDQQHAIANVSFPVTLGHRARFGEIVIDGIPPADQQRLQHSLKTFLARARTVAIRPGKPYHLSTITKATNYLQSGLQKRGLLDADVETGRSRVPRRHQPRRHPLPHRSRQRRSKSTYKARTCGPGPAKRSCPSTRASASTMNPWKKAARRSPPTSRPRGTST